MPKPFDAVMKDLVERYPRDWAMWLEADAAGGVAVIDADLSTVSASADKVLLVGDEDPWLLHLEFQASRDASLPLRVLRYNVLLHERHRAPVLSVVLLLRPEASDPALTGEVRYGVGGGSLDFRYRPLKAWELPFRAFLEGGLGTLPLVAVSDATPEELPGAIRRMESRLEREAEPGGRESLWMTTYLLMGLRHPASVVGELLQGVRAMKESSTYQAILEEGRLEGEKMGRLEGEKKYLLLLGGGKFGSPDERTRERIETLSSIEQIENLTQRFFQAVSWEDLLG